MVEYKKATVIKVEKLGEGIPEERTSVEGISKKEILKETIQEVSLDIDHPNKKALNYTKMTGYLKEGDRVLVNTTACTLNLGTGGYHYIMGNFNHEYSRLECPGHGMKLKYTPNQINVLFSEEQDSPLHEEFHKELNLTGKLVFVGELHSMLVPLCAHIKYCSKEDLKIACIITDHGALPLWISKNIRMLKSKKLLDDVISIGNAFGGDYECVNIYTALQLAANILDVDVIIITMGPGIMGTGTPFGFSGLELGFYLDLCHTQDCISLYTPRISFNDLRNRHYGLSHHYINTFRKIIQNPLPIVLPNMKARRVNFIIEQLRSSDLIKEHPIIIKDGKKIEESLSKYHLEPMTMGRGFKEDPEFFYAQGAIVEYGISKL